MTSHCEESAAALQLSLLTSVLLHLLQNGRRLGEQQFLPLVLLLLLFVSLFGLPFLLLQGCQLLRFAHHLRLYLINRLPLVLFNEGDFIRFAAVLGHRVTGSFVEGLLGETLQGGKVTAALIVLPLFVARHEVLNGGVPLHTHLLAHTLPRRCAVHVHDQNAIRVSIVLSQFVPIRFHGLAVPSPGRKKLHEGILAGVQHFAVEVLVVRVEGALRVAGGKQRE
mmetsp:Transcript_39659/g.71158  ORF Transcript_39659/g.71158 Transcript_39659/m.71158 type:complete len:223 (-) Transcript_39659:155-823(-)